MTVAELDARMPVPELIERMALDRVRGEEQRKADEKAGKGG